MNIRLFVKFFALIFVPIAFLAWVGHYVVLEKEVEKNRQRIEYESRLNKELFVRFIRTNIQVLEFIGSYMNRIMVSPDDAHSFTVYESLESIGQSVLENSDRYSQIRILSLEGQEIFRLEKRFGECVRVSAEELQDKSTRYYMNRLDELSPEKVYMSPLDENHETTDSPLHGLKNFRLGCALFCSGKKCSYLVLNVNADSITEALSLQQAVLPREASWSIYDNAGSELQTPDSACETFQAMKVKYGIRKGGFVCEKGGLRCYERILQVGDISPLLEAPDSFPWTMLLSIPEKSLWHYEPDLSHYFFWGVIVWAVVSLVLAQYMSHYRMRFLRARSEGFEYQGLLQGVLDNIPVFISVVSLPEASKGLGQPHCVLQNTLAHRLSSVFGYTVDSESGDIETPLSLSKEQELRETGNPVTFIEKLRSEHGVTEHYLMTKFPIVSDSGELKYIGTVATDITKRISLEHDLKKNMKKAQQAASDKSMFLAYMGHELRTPLNGIMSSVSLLSRQGLDGRQRDLLGITMRAGKVLKNVISNVLDLSKAEQNGLVLKESPFSLQLIMDDMHDLFDIESRGRGIHFMTTVDKNIQDTVIGDKARIEQIIINLLGNAFKFTEEGRISLGVYLLNENKSMMRVEFVVEDTGSGIDPNTDYFQAFYQGKRHSEGAGLGLPLCRSLARVMGGDITAVPGILSGSVFRCQLPLQKTDVQDESESESDSDVQLRALSLIENVPVYHILIVDDSVLNREPLSYFCEDYGWSHDSACTGLEALEWVKKNEYDVILMDCYMPEMDGFEASRQIRKLGLTTPIVAITANVSSAEKKRCLEAGMNYFLGKPVAFDALEEVILSCPSRSPQRKPITH